MLTAVTGINWGDEGKGRVIDLLAENADVVVRYTHVNFDDANKPYPLSRTFSKEREKQRPLLESLLLIFY